MRVLLLGQVKWQRRIHPPGTTLDVPAAVGSALVKGQAAKPAPELAEQPPTSAPETPEVPAAPTPPAKPKRPARGGKKGPARRGA